MDANHLAELLEALDAAEGRGALPADVAGAFRVFRDHVMVDDDVHRAAHRLIADAIDHEHSVRVFLDAKDEPVAAVFVVLGNQHVEGVREHLKQTGVAADVATATIQ